MIRIEHLQKTFGKERVLKNISVAIKPGEHVAIFGDNGSGKTTLLRCIMGLYRYEGSIKVFNKGARTARSIIAARIGYTPQLPPPISMSVARLINFIFDLAEEPRQQAYDMLHRVGFDATSINRSFRRLSGGMQKKVLLAIALGRAPALLILDEPTAYIDPGSRKIIADVVNGLPPDVTILQTSHASFKMPEIVPSRIIEMDNGAIIKDSYIQHKSSPGKRTE